MKPVNPILLTLATVVVVFTGCETATFHSTPTTAGAPASQRTGIAYFLPHGYVHLVAELQDGSNSNKTSQPVPAPKSPAPTNAPAADANCPEVPGTVRRPRPPPRQRKKTSPPPPRRRRLTIKSPLMSYWRRMETTCSCLIPKPAPGRTIPSMSASKTVCWPASAQRMRTRPARF